MEDMFSKASSDSSEKVRSDGRERRTPIALLLGFVLPPAVALTVLFLGWEVFVRLAEVPVYIVPRPTQVLDRLVGDLGFFGSHGAVTLLEAMGGFLLGSAVAFGAATVMVHARWVERTLYPIALLVKVTPIVAVAPLFVIWFGFGSPPKVLIAALITFFPVLVNSLTGLRSVDPGALDYLRTLDASRAELFIKLRVPSSLPFLFAAARIAVPLSVIGAVVGEWFTGDRGLGSVIIVAHNNIDMPTLFSAVVVLALMGITLTVLTGYLEKKVLFWHDSLVETT